MSKIAVRIDSSRPIFMEADAASFGAAFLTMNADEQIGVLSEMFTQLQTNCPMQLDYIAIELEGSAHANLRSILTQILGSDAA